MLFLLRGPSLALPPVAPAWLARPAWRVAAVAAAAVPPVPIAPKSAVQQPTPLRQSPRRFRFHCQLTGASYFSPSLVWIPSSAPAGEAAQGLWGLFPASRGGGL